VSCGFIQGGSAVASARRLAGDRVLSEGTDRPFPEIDFEPSRSTGSPAA
jgi:hypothetical protein